MKSVWLKQNLIKSLSKTDYILSSSHKYLLKLLNTKNDILILLEPNGLIGMIISCVDGVVIELPVDYLEPLVLAAPNNPQDVVPRKCDRGLLLPMATEKTSVFGYVLIPEAFKIDFDSEKKDALRSFSALLYNEVMGSIVKSFNPALFTVRKLKVVYNNMVTAVNDVSFEINKNEFTVVLGTSGCGKTSLVNVLGGLLTPIEGEVFWENRDISKMKRKQRVQYCREKIGFVFQQYNLIDMLTARENVSIVASLVENPRPAEEVLEMVGMLEKADRYPSQLSGGEQQRVCIARALSKRSSVLICDEPTGALDPENSKKIMSLLVRMVKEEGVPVVMITHNPAFAVLADRCLLMSEGMIVEDIRQPFPLPVESLALR